MGYERVRRAGEKNCLRLEPEWDSTKEGSTGNGVKYKRLSGNGELWPPTELPCVPARISL